jgi:AcrR family transcriptional regulator
MSRNLKTRKQLIEVARELFAKNGKKNVTMNDIAEASKKGRRTLYTYFTSKEEVYKAVIDNELSFVLEKLQLVSAEKLEPEEKLTKHIITHLSAIKEAVNRNGSLRSDFFRDIYEVERTRRKIDVQEIELIRQILAEGVSKRIFKPLNNEMTAIIIFYAIKGLEVPYIRQGISAQFEKNKNTIVEFIFTGIRK